MRQLSEMVRGSPGERVIHEMLTSVDFGLHCPKFWYGSRRNEGKIEICTEVH